jgi:hypothetical protein
MSSWDDPGPAPTPDPIPTANAAAIPRIDTTGAALRFVTTLIRIVFPGCPPKLSIAYRVVMLVIEPEQEVLHR